jgi:hypothetical protein
MRLIPTLLAGSAALALLTHCAGTRQSAPETPPPAEPPPQTPSTPAPSTNPWSQARVGDRAVYAFSTNQGPGRRPLPPRSLAGRLQVEVTAVQAPWVWLTVSFTDDAGKPLSHPWLARDLALPVSMETSRPLEVTPAGIESREQLSAAGRQWEARRYLDDQRPVDGNLVNSLYAAEPGPLYLTRGLLSLGITLSGFGASGGTQLTLLEVRQGAEGRSASGAPSLERPLGPGTWFDFRAKVGGEDTTLRTCVTAERGFILQADGPAPAQGPACPSFAEASVAPMEEWLLRLVTGALPSERWPPFPEGTPTRGTFRLQGRTVPSVTVEKPESEGKARRIRFETYAADPWDAALTGLPYEARFRYLTEGVDAVDARGKRTPQDFTQLTGWGTWLEAAK